MSQNKIPHQTESKSPLPLSNEGQLEFLAAILRDSRDTIILTDEAGKVLCLSASGEHTLGCTQQELMNKQLTSVLSADGQSRIEKFFPSNQTHDQFDCQCRRENGTSFEANLIVTKLSSDVQYCSIIIHDLSDESATLGQLVDSEAKYRQLVESAPVCIHEINLDGTLRSMNRAGLAMIESVPEAVCGIPYLNFVDEDSQDRVGKLLTKAIAGESSEFQFAVDGPHGKLHFSSCFVPIRSESGEVLRLMGITEDITTRLEAEEQKLHNEQRMLHAQKLESLGVLSGGIAHDFNNLLMVILGNVSIAIEDSKDTTILTHLEAIENTAVRAADLCKQLLAYTGKGKFEIRATNLSRLVEDMQQILTVSCSKNVTLRHIMANDLPAVKVDRTQLRQIVMNLVINASDAITNQNGVVTISTGVMDVGADYGSSMFNSDDLNEGKYVFLEVSDTGSGISEAVQRTMFDPFFTTKDTGRGLGLAATMGIVKAHGGAINCYSEVGVGTSVKILLPANAEHAESIDIVTEANEDWRGSGLVLVVDDEDPVRQVAVRMLELIGFEVIAASSGTEAVEIFSNRADELQLVLLDMVMPQMDGKATFTELQKITTSVPVILSSGYNEYETTNLLTGKGLAGFIQKPYDLAVLREKVKDVLTT